MKKEKLYNIVAIIESGERKGDKIYLTIYSMPHQQCCTMISKMTKRDNSRIQLEEDIEA